MTTRTYDTLLTVTNSANFEIGNVLIGSSSAAVGIIAGIDNDNNYLKVKLSNVVNEFSDGEAVHSNVVNMTASGSGTLASVPFNPNVFNSFSTTATSTITNIASSGFIAAKNAYTQQPIVRLYSVYFPGEWYPPNKAGNPQEQGLGYAWPSGFPIRFAEVIGDLANDISYNVLHNATSYIPFPLTVSGFSEGSDGKINEASLDIFNVDNIITGVVENPFLVGLNTSNSCVALVNGEYVDGLDPRTINANPADLSAAPAGLDAVGKLTRARANALVYDSAVQAQYGQANAAFGYEQTKEVNGNWKKLKIDTRDLLGGVVEIKTTFAHFLDYWPEYSLVESLNTNEVVVTNSLPYRVGDSVTTSSGSVTATITAISLLDHIITLDTTLDGSVNDALYIINAEKDSDSYVQDSFKIEQLESLSDHVATFGLTSWLQYFKIVTPKHKYYKNTCRWVYKGEECQYPGPNGGTIPGTDLQANTNPIGLDNQITTADLDACSGSVTACRLRNNQKHFGGFPGTGRSLPRN